MEKKEEEESEPDDLNATKVELFLAKKEGARSLRLALRASSSAALPVLMLEMDQLNPILPIQTPRYIMIAERGGNANPASRENECDPEEGDTSGGRDAISRERT